MKRSVVAVAILTCSLLAACRDEPSKNVAGLSEKTYQASGAPHLPMTFPGGSDTVFKPFGKYKDKEHPKPYQQPNTWVVYMAAPGWTNGGLPIVERLGTDAVAVERVKRFIFANNLQSQVKVAWLQYDQNPGGRFMESLDTVPDNFIPLFLKGFGPQVDFYIHSAARHAGQPGKGMRYDQWLKPYLPFAKKDGDDYVAATDFQRAQGFDDANGKYWNSWARHWFIVNPDGVVMDAYFSNLGRYYIQGADRPINALIHHLKLNADSLDIPKIVSANYESFWTPPYWEQLDDKARATFGLEARK